MTKNPLLLRHGGIKDGYNGTKRAYVYPGVVPSPQFIGLMESVADSIEGVICILRGEDSMQIVLVIEPGARASEVTKLWIREANSRIRNMLPDLLPKLDGAGHDPIREAMAENSIVRSFGGSGE